MKRLLTSCFGLGNLPVCPGTWGSLPPVIIFALMCWLGSPAVLTAIVMAVFALAGSFVCVKFSPAVIEATGKTDPGEVVADEFAGQAVTFFVVLFFAVGEYSAVHIAAIAALGFLLFRLFDIVKPWPVRKLEKLPQGWGILADDLLAGVYAAVALFLFHTLWMIYRISLES